ncbi:hypothetical protein BDZ97DRAFT_805264 [Flammula alnicola]|nr:hypothetical protein BDZ97DRAFT_805264 [Flammula alnicola]
MDVIDSKEGSPYITNFDLVPPSPPRSIHNDFDQAYYDANNPLTSPPFAHTHTPSYNGSYYNSPFSQHSQLSFTGDELNYELLQELASMNEYEPSEYDAGAPPGTAATNGSSLLMFAGDTEYSSIDFSPDAHDHRTHGSPFDHSSPSSNGDEHVGAAYDLGMGNNTTNTNNNNNYDPSNTGGRHSRASSVGSAHHSPSNAHLSPSPSPQPSTSSFHPQSQSQVQPHPQPHPSPRLDVAHSFGNMSVHTPNWGTQPLPQLQQHSPLLHPQALGQASLIQHSPSPLQKPQSPPRLRMPDGILDGILDGAGNNNNNSNSNNASGLGARDQSSLLTAVPKINAPDGHGDDGDEDDDVNMGGDGGPQFHIVPATPVSGGGEGPRGVPFQQTLATLAQGGFLVFFLFL